MAMSVAPLLVGMAQATPTGMTFIAPANLVMPLLEVDHDGRVTQGLLKDLGEAIASQLKLSARFLPLPSRRVGWALASGLADGVCYVRPNWIDGDFNWSDSLISNQGWVVSRRANESVQTVRDLQNRPVGTVLGYQYPDLELALGSHFMRDDAPSMALNLQKLDGGRFEFAVTEKNTMDYLNQRRIRPRLVPVVALSSFDTQCAFSKKSQIPFSAVDTAIKALVANGTVERLRTQHSELDTAQASRPSSAGRKPLSPFSWPD